MTGDKLMIPFPKKKYNIIYADPPWDYKFGKSSSRYIKNKYQTMSLEQICKLPVKNITDDNAILLIWITFPKLDWAFPVIKAWGFEYKTIFINWVKTYKNGNIFMGCGYYTRSNSEVCLLAKKGKGLDRKTHNINSVLHSPYLGHSKKPPEVRDKIVELFGDLPRIELFARPPKDRLFEDKSFEGWDVWGNEV